MNRHGFWKMIAIMPQGGYRLLSLTPFAGASSVEWTFDYVHFNLKFAKGDFNAWTHEYPSSVPISWGYTVTMNDSSSLNFDLDTIYALGLPSLVVRRS